MLPNKGLFKKCAVFTDIHLGLKHNSKDHNEDCIEFLKWFIAQAKAKGAETCISMGDFHHHRNSVNAVTQNYMITALQMLNDNFEKVYFLVGNHDLYFRENRSITTSRFATLFPNVIMVDQPIIIDDTALVPWLVEDEWKDVAEMKTKYLFGHLELPGFKMNAMIDMPDHGMLNATHFEFQDYVFSGHFHLRQTKGKINYIGNPFGHNFSDVWDFDRGAMFLEWNGEPEYVNYADGPRFINIPLSSLMADPEKYLLPKTHLQVVLDIDITYEEATYLRETFIEQYSIREFKLIRSKEETTSTEGKDITMKTVDTIVIEQLLTVVDGTCTGAKLIEIYNRL
jgi:DNA repair exonuclease SbcCD nuclease subunit